MEQLMAGQAQDVLDPSREADPEQLLPMALCVVRSGIVRMTLDEFLALGHDLQKALALAGDIVAGRKAHPDDVCSLLAAGEGDPDRARRVQR